MVIRSKQGFLKHIKRKFELEFVSRFDRGVLWLPNAGLLPLHLTHIDDELKIWRLVSKFNLKIYFATIFLFLAETKHILSFIED